MSSDSKPRLVLVRHAIAEGREEYARTGLDDSTRPLTPKGRRRMRQAARGLREVLGRPDLLASSPMARAVQTAEILSEVWDGIPVAEVAPLAAGPASAFLDWYREAAPAGTVVAVGHEPWLGEWASWLLTGLESSFVVFKKGGACLLEFPDGIAPSAALLGWHLAPSHLRALGE